MNDNDLTPADWGRIAKAIPGFAWEYGMHPIDGSDLPPPRVGEYFEESSRTNDNPSRNDYPDPYDGPTGWLLFELLGPGVSLKVRANEDGSLACTIVVPRELTPDGRHHAVNADHLGICAIKAARIIGRWPGGAK